MSLPGYIIVACAALSGVVWFFGVRFKGKIHGHAYRKPVASMYVGFNTRDIIYECPCGSRQVFRVQRSFSNKFPIPTDSMVTQDQFDDLLMGATRAYVGLGPIAGYDD